MNDWMSHTPGPWEVEIVDGYITGRILGHPSFAVNGERLQVVGRSTSGEGVQRQVDAHLIAAAPELLAALIQAEKLMNYMGDILNGMDCVQDEDIEMSTPIFAAVEAAIAKARPQ